MSSDSFSQSVSIDRDETRAAFDVYSRDWVEHGPGVRSIIAAADQDQGCCIVNAHAAAIHMASESASGFRVARRYLMRARATARDANEREQQFSAAVYDWWRGNSTSALERIVELNLAHPGDAVAAKWAQYLAFNAGDGEAMLRVSESVVSSRPDLAEAWSMHAFSLEQAFRLSEAEACAGRALSMKQGDAWAQHAMAHVFYTKGLPVEGAAFLEHHRDGWTEKSVFIREHNSWHLALFYLAQKRYDEALDLFDSTLWGETPDVAQEQIGAISFLWRLELLGVDAGDRWTAIADKIQERWHEHILPFLDLHYVYALARGGRRQAVQAFLASMERRGESDNSGVWQSLAIPCARGLAKFVDQDYARAAELIAPLLGRLQFIGGSHVQRDVIARTWIYARARKNRARVAAFKGDRRVEMPVAM